MTNEIINLSPGLIALISIIALWTLPWKGVALWKAAKQHDIFWFVALLILNTIGILEILYIFWISKRKIESKKETEIPNSNPPQM